MGVYLSIIGWELPKKGLPTNSPSKIWSNKASKLPKTDSFIYHFSHNHQGLFLKTTIGDTPISQPWFLQGRVSPPTIKKGSENLSRNLRFLSLTLKSWIFCQRSALSTVTSWRTIGLDSLRYVETLLKRNPTWKQSKKGLAWFVDDVLYLF